MKNKVRGFPAPFFSSGLYEYLFFVEKSVMIEVVSKSLKN